MNLIEHLEYVVGLVDGQKPLTEIKSAVIAMQEQVSEYEQTHSKTAEREAKSAEERASLAQENKRLVTENERLIAANAKRKSAGWKDIEKWAQEKQKMENSKTDISHL